MQRVAVFLLVVGGFLLLSGILGSAGVVPLVLGFLLSVADAVRRREQTIFARLALGLGILSVIAVASLWLALFAVVTAPLAMVFAFLARHEEPRMARTAFVLAGAGILGVFFLVVYGALT